jgi:hypothetical protein
MTKKSQTTISKFESGNKGGAHLTIQTGVTGYGQSGKLKISCDEFLARLADKAEEDGDEDGGKIVTILRLWRAGYLRSEIVAAGFNRSTVYRQVGDYEKLRKAPATSYYGFELYEARVQRVMARKKISRDKAIQFIADQDIDKD